MSIVPLGSKIEIGFITDVLNAKYLYKAILRILDEFILTKYFTSNPHFFYAFRKSLKRPYTDIYKLIEHMSDHVYTTCISIEGDHKIYALKIQNQLILFDMIHKQRFYVLVILSVNHLFYILFITF